MTISLEGMHQTFWPRCTAFSETGKRESEILWWARNPFLLITCSQSTFQYSPERERSKTLSSGKGLWAPKSLFSETKPDTESCPFLNDQETVRKIKHAKEYLLKNSETPPSLKELQSLLDWMNINWRLASKKFTVTVFFGFSTRSQAGSRPRLTDTQKYQVNEVAYQFRLCKPKSFYCRLQKRNLASHPRNTWWVKVN